MTSFPPLTEVDRIAGYPVVDEDGDSIGVVASMFADRGRETLEWAAVDVGILGRRHLVPLADAFVGPGFIQVGYPKSRVERSPVADDSDELVAALEERLYAHYGLPWEDEGPGAGHEPPGGGEGADRVLVRRPSLLERIAYS